MVSRKKGRHRGGAAGDGDKPIDNSGDNASANPSSKSTKPSLLSPSTWPTQFMIYVVLAAINILYMVSSSFTKRTEFPLKPNRNLGGRTTTGTPAAGKTGKTMALETTSENGTGASLVVTSNDTEITGVKVSAVATGDGYKPGDTLTVSKEDLNVDGGIGTVDGPVIIKITDDDLDQTETVTGVSVGLSLVTACIFAGLMWWLCISGRTTMAWGFLLLPVIAMILLPLIGFGLLKMAY
jgi:hypothetical protein